MIHYPRKYIIGALSVALLLAPLLPAHAQGAIHQGAILSDDCNNLGLNCRTSTFPGIANRLIKYINNFLGLVSVVVFAVLIYGAFLYVTSRGDESGAAKAKLTIVSALVGLAIIGVAAAVVNATVTLIQ